MVDFLTHYYRKGTQPFLSLSQLSDIDAARLGMELFDADPAMFRRFENFDDYWSRRRRTDRWVRSEFERKGGQPVEAFPQYFVLGVSDYIRALGNNTAYAELRIPLSEFQDEEVSFTYSDCMVSLWLFEEHQDKGYFNEELHGKVFTIPEILNVVQEHGIPNGEWESDPQKSFDFFVEAQVWSLRPIQAYLSEQDGSLDVLA